MTTSGWLYNVLERRPGNLDGATRKPLMNPCQHVSGVINISRLAGHAVQQQVLLECLGIRQMFNSMKSSITDHLLDATLRPSTPSNSGSPKNLQTVSALSHSSSLLISQNTYRQSYSHHIATEKVEEPTPFGAAASVTPVYCGHKPACPCRVSASCSTSLHCSFPWPLPPTDDLF